MNKETFMAKKTFSRNTQALFTAGFFTDSTYTTPITPLSSIYPTYSIRNPIGDVVHSGTAVSYLSDGNYKVEWTIPTDAMLSSDNDEWNIEWTMVSSDNRQLQFKQPFFVVDARVETPEDHSIIQVACDSEEFRLNNYFESEVQDITVNVYQAKNTTTPILTYTQDDLTGPVNIEGHIAYYVNCDEGLPQGDYLIMWRYRNDSVSSLSREFKTLRVVRTTVLRFVDQLRILIDRFNKRQAAPNAYSDSDLIEFLNRGLDMVNCWYPQSTPAITWDSIDGTNYPIFVIAGSAAYALQSQYLLETDLSFNFSGQTTVLDFDRTGNIDNAYQKLLEFLNTNLTKAKIAVTRSAGIGSVAVRPYSVYNNARNRVIMYEGSGAQTGSSVWSLMVVLGL